MTRATLRRLRRMEAQPGAKPLTEAETLALDAIEAELQALARDPDAFEAAQDALRARVGATDAAPMV